MKRKKQQLPLEFRGFRPTVETPDHAFEEIEKARLILLEILDNSITTDKMAESVGFARFTKREAAIWQAATTAAYNKAIRNVVRMLGRWHTVEAANRNFFARRGL